ncbi:hypothetical protein L0663_11335 [Dyadobacter sp. CY107]|uniref:hypothetical protein n=1 Tax=Dyadobacter fanqingshengii TaxID=2906443 RepID=UPI001F300C53|nr:hypothetical protein [Dyadobacter fanqingshengii]MCF2503974.1 hypothetical protein [Dyadobacter fanqingshengii]
MINRIKDLIQYAKNSVKLDFGNLMKTLTGSVFTPKEHQALDALGDNVETFTKQSAETLAGAHEDGKSGIDTQMDGINNAAGASIYTQFGGSGTSSQWADRVKAATNLGQHGLVFVKNKVLVSAKEIDPNCP